MTRTAFERDGILSPEDRLASARKCVALLVVHVNEMTHGEAEFFRNQSAECRRIKGYVSERQLAWLRDLVSKYDA